MERLTEWDEYGNADIIALSDVMPEIYAELSFDETNVLVVVPVGEGRVLQPQAEGGGGMTIDWLFIGYVLGFVTAAWICPAADKAFKKWRRRE